jgi:thiamine-phosphate pyrophosphorylase
MPADLRDRLDAARLYLCTNARERQRDLTPFLDAVLSSGVDIVQLRQKNLEAAQELRFLEAFRASCDRHGALLAVNDRADVAYAAGADVLHLGQQDLPVEAAAAAAMPGVDYFCAGPVWATPTKPGRPAAGIGLITRAAGLAAGRPWFAIGGISHGNLDEVLAAGALRVVVVRAITEAADPAAATAQLAARLRAAQRDADGGRR